MSAADTLSQFAAWACTDVPVSALAYRGAKREYAEHPPADSDLLEPSSSKRRRADSRAERPASPGGPGIAVVRGRKGLVWTVELHQQFLDAINTLGLDNACPKKILRMMGVAGLTRENVSSHLQKYRMKLSSELQGREGGRASPARPSSAGPADLPPLPVAAYALAVRTAARGCGSPSPGSDRGRSPAPSSPSSPAALPPALSVPADAALSPSGVPRGWCERMLQTQGAERAPPPAARLLPLPTPVGSTAPTLRAPSLLAGDPFARSSPVPAAAEADREPPPLGAALLPASARGGRRPSAASIAALLSPAGEEGGSPQPGLVEAASTSGTSSCGSERAELEREAAALDDELPPPPLAFAAPCPDLARLWGFVYTLWEDYAPRARSFTPRFAASPAAWEKELAGARAVLAAAAEAERTGRLDVPAACRALRSAKAALLRSLAGSF